MELDPSASLSPFRLESPADFPAPLASCHLEPSMKFAGHPPMSNGSPNPVAVNEPCVRSCRPPCGIEVGHLKRLGEVVEAEATLATQGQPNRISRWRAFGFGLPLADCGFTSEPSWPSSSGVYILCFPTLPNLSFPLRTTAPYKPLTVAQHSLRLLQSQSFNQLII